MNFDPQSSTKNITVQFVIASRLISPNSQYSYPIPNCHKLLFATRELPFLFTFPGYLFHPCHHVHRPAYKPRHESSVKKKEKRRKCTACLLSILNRLPLSNIIRLIIVSRIPGPVQFVASFIKQASKRIVQVGGRTD